MKKETRSGVILEDLVPPSFTLFGRSQIVDLNERKKGNDKNSRHKAGDRVENREWKSWEHPLGQETN